ncbi:MAG: TetR/AcrR family transcriptional regulator [Myxococcota bacterium]
MAQDSSIRAPQQSRGKKTRAALLAAAAREFSERGYAKTTAKSITERAQTSTGSFYQYFKNKDALLLELVEERHRTLEAKTTGVLENAPGQPTRTHIRRVVEAVFAVHRADPGFHGVFTERRHADSALDRAIGRYEAKVVLAVGVLLDGWGFEGDTEATAFVLFGMLEGAAHAHVLGLPVVDDDRLTNALVDAIMRITGFSKGTNPWP